MKPKDWKQGDEFKPGPRARKGVRPPLSPFPISWLGLRSRITLEDGRESMLFPFFNPPKAGKEFNPCLNLNIFLA
ncbi:MAG: hypothetical protein ACPLYF_00820 [Fervidobacterium sp.]